MGRTEGGTRWMRYLLRAVCVAGVAIVVLVGGAVSARAELAPGCPTHTYLGNNPNGTDWPDWSELAQGVTNDGQHWYFTSKSDGLFKYHTNWSPLDGPDVGLIAHVGFPPELASLGIDHFGDPDYYAGYIFVPFEGKLNDQDIAIIAAFRASDLSLVDWRDVTPFQIKAGWLAIHPVERLLYTSGNHLVAGSSLLRYNLDIRKIEDAVQGDFLTVASSMPVYEADGSDIQGEFIYMQGGDFTPWGDLYLAVGMAERDAEPTRGGIHLFRRTPDGTSFRLAASSVNEADHVGEAVFAYEYHPGWSLDPGEEPEGLDWWNRDVPGWSYGGQLHAVLLDNQLGDDPIWLKHYRVDYSCVANDDSDGDGLTDHDEVYVYNTSPLLSDTDGDGQSDGAEVACGSNPLDATSVSADFDGDSIPDCVDTDDDGDGVADTADRCPGTLIPDPKIPSSGTLKKNRYALLDNDLIFDGGNADPPYTTTSTGGCNASQIADAMGLGPSHYEYGITRSVLDEWIASQP